MKADIKIRVTVTDAERSKKKSVVVDGVWAKDDLILVWKWEPDAPGVPADSFTSKKARSRITKAADGVFELPGSTFVVQSVDSL
jgi:hypothetical protein